MDYENLLIFRRHVTFALMSASLLALAVFGGEVMRRATLLGLVALVASVCAVVAARLRWRWAARGFALGIVVVAIFAAYVPIQAADAFGDITLEGGGKAPPAITSGAVPRGASFVVGFSPDGGAEDVVIDAIRQAKKTVMVAAYAFTSKPVALALRDAHQRGVEVRIVVDAKANNGGKYSAATFLANQGVPVRSNGRYAIHHNKFLVIDGVHIETGSFNFSGNAARANAENVLLLRNVPEIAERYAREWARLWEEGTDVAPRY